MITKYRIIDTGKGIINIAALNLQKVNASSTKEIINEGSNGTSPYVELDELPEYTLSSIDGSNTFSLLKDGNEITTLDLTPYLDNINLARITEGVLNPVTGILTLTRDDATDLTIDLSNLIDVQESFIGLPDTPDSYTGSGGFELVVADTEDKVEFIPRTYIHDQGTPSSVWTVNHPLRKLKPSVTVTSSLGVEVEGEVQYIDNANLTITFNASFSGEASLN